MKKYIYQKSSITQNPAIAEFIQQRHGWGCSLRQIEQDVEQQFGVHYAPNTIRAYILSLGSITKSVLDGDSQLKEQLKDRILDTIEQLRKINDQTNEILEKAKKDETKLQAIKEIREQLFFQEKILNRFMSGFDVEHISRIEYTKIAVNNLDELERCGYIKILKKPGMDSTPEES